MLIKLLLTAATYSCVIADFFLLLCGPLSLCKQAFLPPSLLPAQSKRVAPTKYAAPSLRAIPTHAHAALKMGERRALSATLFIAGISSFSADTLLLWHAAGIFDGLTKGLESLVGAEEVNLGAPKVAAIDRPLSWTVGMFEVPDPRHPMEDAWFAGKSLNFHAYKYLMSRTKCAATLRRL